MSLRVGIGFARGHHGELLQGAFRDENREVHRGLITLPCKLLSTKATLHIEDSRGDLTVSPSWKTKALRAAKTTIDALGSSSFAGTLRIQGNVQVGMGFGSSTSDVTAAIRAVLDAFSAKMKDSAIARIAVESETAADPLMFDDIVLFAHREGKVIECFGAPLPPITVLGFPLGIGPVDTLKYPAAVYSDTEIDQFHLLLDRMRSGLLKQNPQEVAAVATESAQINQRFIPVPNFERFREIGSTIRAMGLQVAHSGNVGGLLFDPLDPDLAHKIHLANQELSTMGITQKWNYTDGSTTTIPDRKPTFFNEVPT